MNQRMEDQLYQIIFEHHDYCLQIHKDMCDHTITIGDTLIESFWTESDYYIHLILEDYQVQGAIDFLDGNTDHQLDDDGNATHHWLPFNSFKMIDHEMIALQDNGHRYEPVSIRLHNVNGVNHIIFNLGSSWNHSDINPYHRQYITDLYKTMYRLIQTVSR